MERSRRNLCDAGNLRPVLAAWLLALVASAGIAFAAGFAQLRKIDRDRAIADSDRQLGRLYTLLVANYNSTRETFERDVLGGYRLPGEPQALSYDPSDVVPDEGTLFRFDPPTAVGPSTGPAIRTVLRTTVEGRHIGPDFAAWNLRLKFVDDRLAGAHAASPERLNYRRPIAGIAPVQRLAKATLIVAAGVALLCLVAANAVGARWRRQIAAIGLAAAVLTVAAANLQPVRDRGATLAAPSVAVAWTSVIAALGLAALLPPRRANPADHPRCRCGYDLTGNVSGICPECGSPTARGRIDRWADTAAAIESVGVNAASPRARQNSVPGGGSAAPFSASPMLTSLKESPEDVDIRRYQRAMVGSTLACYRYAMSDNRLGPEPQEGPPDGYAGDEVTPQVVTCPTCATVFEITSIPESGVLMCPTCSAEFMASSGIYDDIVVDDDTEDTEAAAERELAERMEVERRAREVELDSVRVKQVLTERRSLFRIRSYFIVAGVTAAVAAVQLGIWGHRRWTTTGADLFVAGYGLAIVGLLVAAVFFWRRVRQLNEELAQPAQTEPTIEPDFSTLSDGSQRLDTAADNLARLYDRKSS